MRVLEQVEIQLQWSDLESLTYHPRIPELRRTDMPHVSQILQQYAKVNDKWTREDEEDQMPLRILLGLAFEEAAARLYPSMTWQPGQVEWDGVVGSPDGHTWLTQSVYETLPPCQVPRWCVDEFKYTGKSQRVPGAPTQPDGTVDSSDLKDIRTEWMWMHQGMSYINLLRRRFHDRFSKLNLCRFHICWKYGAYTRPFAERYMRYLVMFEETELRGNWAMMQANKGLVSL